MLKYRDRIYDERDKVLCKDAHAVVYIREETLQKAQTSLGLRSVALPPLKLPPWITMRWISDFSLARSKIRSSMVPLQINR